MAQTVSSRPLTTEACVWARINPPIFGVANKFGTGDGFSPVTFYSPVGILTLVLHNYTMKTHYNKHYDKLRIQPPHRTQNCSVPTKHQENANPTTNNRTTKNRMDDNKSNSKKQQFPRPCHNATTITNTTKTHKTGNNETGTKTNKKWAVFTYCNPTIRKVTNLFKHTDVGIAFRNTNKLYQLTKPKTCTQTQEKNKSGVYALTCNTCKQAYIGQTS